MNNLRQFPHPDHAGEVATPADTERLQRLIRNVLEETNSSAAAVSHSQEVRIRNFRSAKYELVNDLMVVIEEREGGEYVATSFDTGQYGHGYSPDAAIQHLCSVLEDYYELLLEDEGRLSERLESHLRYLHSILRARK